MINISDILFRSIGFSVCAFFFLLSAIFILIYKMKKNVERRKLYNYMIIFTLAVIILEIIIPFTIQYKDVIPTLNEILCKIYLLFVFLWPAIFLIYLFSYKKEYLNKTFSIIVIICVCLCVLACLFIPFEYSTTTIYTIKGPLVVLMHLYCLSISFFEIIVLITKK